MPPKFQSTFIPKSPATAPSMLRQTPRASGRDFAGFLVKTFFALTVLGALAVTGYKFYLGYSLSSMESELETMRAELATGAVDELVDLDNRIVSAQTLLKNHRVLTPLFTYLQTATPQTVRFTDFVYDRDQDGLHVMIKGQAKSYAALAVEANALENNPNFKNTVFSDLRLDEKGNVTFTAKMLVTPEFLSYERFLAGSAAAVPAVVIPVASTTPVTASSTTATSTNSRQATTTTTRTATSTPRN